MSKTPLRIVFASGNANKVKEVNRILSTSAFSIVQNDVDLPEFQGETEFIAKEKCLYAVRALNVPVLVEDTSLCYNALNGLPGPYVKWFLKKTGLEGLVNLLRAYEDKSAYALCTFAFCEGVGSPVIIFEGKCKGSIVASRGRTDFGWDSVFQAEETGKTFGEMKKTEKDQISHRSKALEKVSEYLTQKYGT